jgi:hypothetical protein
VEHAQPIDREFSWAGALLALALLGAIAGAVLGGWSLIQGLGGTGSASASGKPAASLRPRSATSVLVLNGNGRAGAAGGVANRTLRRGYREAQATNAPVANYARSIVLFRPGWRGEAKRLANDSHIGAFAPLDGRLPAGDGRFQLVLIVGH